MLHLFTLESPVRCGGETLPKKRRRVVSNGLDLLHAVVTSRSPLHRPSSRLLISSWIAMTVLFLRGLEEKGGGKPR